MSGQASSAAQLPDDAWRDAHMIRAWRTRDFRAVFHRACHFGMKPEDIADGTGLPLEQVLSVMRGNAALDSPELVVSVARGLRMPDAARKAADVLPTGMVPVSPVPQQRTLRTRPRVLRGDHPGIRIRQLRNDRGWSKEYLAERADVSVPTIDKIERQERNPSLEMMRRIAGALGVPVAEIVDSLSLEKTSRNGERPPDRLPDDLMSRPDFIAACGRRDLSEIFRTVVDDAGFLVSHLARLCEMTITQVKAYMWDDRKPTGPIIVRVSDGLHIPGEMLGIGRRPWEERVSAEPVENEADLPLARRAEAVAHYEPPTSGPAVREDDELVERLRRTFLAGGLAALALPALGLHELRHIAAAVDNARRYADTEIVEYCKRQLEDCAVSDGRRGPRQSLPIALGLIAAIEKMATDAKPGTRHELLRVGAYASEFAGWLYRDIAAPELANYWRDRAMEWAQVSGDTPMQGYVLLKKSQAVWGERDALRMLTLAEAAQEGPWRLPARVRAEAAQQQARGHAMLNGNLPLIESKLSEARSLLAQDRANGQMTDVAAHYDEALFGLQVAICYCEAGLPEKSLELYDRWLSPQTLSRRDYAYFLSLKGAAHAAADQPDMAAIAGLTAFAIAREAESVRTVRELIRLAVQLDKWRNLESVHELRAAILVT